MKIIKATLNDFERLQALFLTFSEGLADIAPDYYATAYQDFSLFTGIVEHKSADILIAELDGVPVGMATVWVCERPLSPHIKPQRTLRLSYLIAESDKARDALISSAENIARENGIDRIQIMLHQNDTEAQNLYTDMDFSPEIISYTRKICKI
ncbi:MAG: GNAT family N-acetyltransferase [Clostridia bacterium]|nr:GNAT family N-acetyltransferase [Clostridia bacterium]